MRQGALLLAVLVALLSLNHSSSDGDDTLCPYTVKNRIDTLIATPPLDSSRWGVLAVSHPAGDTLYASNHHRLFTAGACSMLLTGAAAYSALPSFYPTFTVAAASATATGDGLRLCIKGAADPSLSFTNLTSLAKFIHDGGITRISSLRVDDTFFTGQASEFPPSWTRADLVSDYAAPVTAFPVDGNVVTLTVQPSAIVGHRATVSFVNHHDAACVGLVASVTTVGPGIEEDVTPFFVPGSSKLHVQGSIRARSGSKTIRVSTADPRSRTTCLLRAALADVGVVVDKVEETGQCEAGWREVATLGSPPMRDLLNHTLQENDRLYAEMFLRTIGAERGKGDALDEGIKGVGTILSDLGVKEAAYQLRDGSGISRNGLASPEALVQVLRAMVTNNEFRQFLPRAGIHEGTLATRFVGTPLEGKLQAIPGNSVGVQCLSGFFSHDVHKRILFAIVVEGSTTALEHVQRSIDEIPLLLHRLRRCSPNCPHGCSGRGVCYPDGTCDCEDGYLGTDCASVERNAIPQKHVFVIVACSMLGAAILASAFTFLVLRVLPRRTEGHHLIEGEEELYL